MTFDIKVSTNPDRAPLKLRISEHEDKTLTVKNFCQTYRINKDREEIILNEVLQFFERRQAESINKAV